MKKIYGLTLIELLLTIVIVAIIAGIGLNTYSNFRMKGRRADGINAILAVSLAEERYRANNTQYGTLAQAYGGVSTSPQSYYTIAVSSVSATAYTITATASGTQAGDAEGSTSCTTLTMTVSAGTVTKTPAACWPT